MVAHFGILDILLFHQAPSKVYYNLRKFYVSSVKFEFWKLKLELDQTLDTIIKIIKTVIMHVSITFQFF